MEERYYPGKGCQCYAHSESECACPDVDWTDPEVYELREENMKLKKEIEELKESRESWNRLFKMMDEQKLW